MIIQRMATRWWSLMLIITNIFIYLTIVSCNSDEGRSAANHKSNQAPHLSSNHDNIFTKNNLKRKILRGEAMAMVEAGITSKKENSLGTTVKGDFTNVSSDSEKFLVERRTRDIEDILNEMADKNPEEWSLTEWIILILFLCFFGWLGCCLCSLMCCCDRGGGGNLLGWFCLWELCCRDGRDLDNCCDYVMA